MMSTMDSLMKFFQKTTGEGSGKSQGVANPHRVMPYGDIFNDGAVQLSFTLPVETSPEAKEAAKYYVEKMGLKDAHVATMEGIGQGFTYFVVFAHAKHAIDFTKIKAPKAQFHVMSYEEVNQFAEERIRRPLVVLGAATGTDAHTVGIDAILNMKGYMGDYGLERYPCFKVYNLRAQVSHEELIEKAWSLKADAILISKIVTQRSKHLEELKEFAALMKASKKLNTPLVKIVGGPRLTHLQATKLGYDAGFGPGTMPREVASFIVQEYVRRARK